MQDWMFIPIILVIGVIMVVGWGTAWKIATGRAKKTQEAPAASSRQEQADPRGSRGG
jgi:hypothetical protein